MLLAFVVIKCLNQTRINVGVSVLIFNFYVIKERLWIQKGSIKSYIFRPDFSLLKPNPTIALNNLLTLFGFFSFCKCKNFLRGYLAILLPVNLFTKK
jgi:hypothetical protein